MKNRIVVFLLFVLILFIESFTFVSKTLAQDYARLSLKPTYDNEVKVELEFVVKPSSIDRLVLASFTVEMEPVGLFHDNVIPSSAYGWFIKSGNQNQLWIGKVLKANQKQCNITFNIPAMIIKKEESNRNSVLYISLNNTDGLPAFLQDSPKTIAYTKFKYANITIPSVFSIKKKEGWKHDGTSILYWEADHDFKEGKLMLILEWRPPYEQQLGFFIFILSGLTSAAVLSLTLRKLCNKNKKIYLLLSILIFVVALTISFIIDKKINSQYITALRSFSCMMLIGIFLPKSFNEFISTFK